MKGQAAKLSMLLPHLPGRDRDERPPFMRTLALWDALADLGCPCEIWNAVIESPVKIQTICAVRMQGELLDWHGFNPYDYPRIYPIFQGASIRNESGHELIPGKREQAVEKYPEVHEQVRMALQWAQLQRNTQDPVGEAHITRL